jgi:hypothetical protein
MVLTAMPWFKSQSGLSIPFPQYCILVSETLAPKFLHIFGHGRFDICTETIRKFWI